MGADKKEPLFRTQSQPSVHAGLRDGLVVVAIGTEKLPEYWWAIQLSTGAFEEEYGQSPIYFLIQSKPQSLSPSEADNKATKFVESQSTFEKYINKNKSLWNKRDGANSNSNEKNKVWKDK